MMKVGVEKDVGLGNGEAPRRFDIFIPIILIVVGVLNLELIFSRKVVFGALVAREFACEGHEKLLEKVCGDEEVDYWKPFPIYVVLLTLGVIATYGIHRKLYRTSRSNRSKRILRATLGISPGILMIAGGLCLGNFGAMHVEGIGVQINLAFWNLQFVALSVLCSTRYLRE